MNSTCCVDMYGPQTILKANPAIMGKEPPERNFAFDYSYWSFDGYKVEADGYFSPEEGSKYADQKSSSMIWVLAFSTMPSTASTVVYSLMVKQDRVAITNIKYTPIA